MVTGIFAEGLQESIWANLHSQTGFGLNGEMCMEKSILLN